MTHYYYTWTVDDILCVTIDSTFRLPMDRLKDTGIEPVTREAFHEAVVKLNREGAPADIMILTGQCDPVRMDRLVEGFWQSALMTMAQSMTWDQNNRAGGSDDG